MNEIDIEGREELVVFDTRQVLGCVIVSPESAAGGHIYIESPIFDAMAAHYLRWKELHSDED